jgi:arylformamidase
METGSTQVDPSAVVGQPRFSEAAWAEGWRDVSVPIRAGMVHWPGNPAVELERTEDLEHGDPATVSRLSLGVHTGTHVDAPVHFIAGAAGVEALPLEALLGPARVLAIGDPRSIGVDALRALEPRPGERLLFKTRNSPHCWQAEGFVEDFVYLSLEGARFLAERRVRTVGIDYLSIAGMEDGVATHRALLDADICIIEGLDLTGVEAGGYEMLALPMRIEGADGAPARVLLRRRPID